MPELTSILRVPAERDGQHKQLQLLNEAVKALDAFAEAKTKDFNSRANLLETSIPQSQRAYAYQEQIDSFYSDARAWEEIYQHTRQFLHMPLLLVSHEIMKKREEA